MLAEIYQSSNAASACHGRVVRRPFISLASSGVSCEGDRSAWYGLQLRPQGENDATVVRLNNIFCSRLSLASPANTGRWWCWLPVMIEASGFATQAKRLTSFTD